MKEQQKSQQRPLTFKLRNVLFYLSPVSFFVHIGATIAVLNCKTKQIHDKINYKTPVNVSREISQWFYFLYIECNFKPLGTGTFLSRQRTYCAAVK